MSGGFEHDPEAMRGFAEVFTLASEQVAYITESVGNTSAKADSFGNSWHEQGGNFERYMADIAADLGKLSVHLGEVGAQLTQTTDLSIQADSSGYTNITDVSAELEGEGPK
jgi:hypothetical protein